MPNLIIKPLADSDREWARQIIRLNWGSEKIIIHHEVYYPAELDGFTAWLKGKREGLITYKIERKITEIITLNAFKPNLGIGTALIKKVENYSRKSGCQSLILTTTNDNIQALRFYQKLGFCLKALRTGVVNEARALKSEIPFFGNDNIPIRDEIDLELEL